MRKLREADKSPGARYRVAEDWSQRDGVDREVRLPAGTVIRVGRRKRLDFLKPCSGGVRGGACDAYEVVREDTGERVWIHRPSLAAGEVALRVVPVCQGAC